MLKVGIVGFGFMGQTHYKCWKKVEGAQVAAICDVNPNIEEDTKRAVGNIGDGAEEVDFSSLNVYADFDEMLAKEKLDAVSITLPTYLHPETSIKALAAGVNVMCEKPMALTSKNCEGMIAEAKSSGKILQIGHCVRFWPEYAKAKEMRSAAEESPWTCTSTTRTTSSIYSGCRRRFAASEQKVPAAACYTFRPSTFTTMIRR
jgi:predicted dehydrogenase